MRGNPLQTLTLRVRSWALEVNAFYRPNKLDAAWPCACCQLSWSPGLLMSLEEGAEIEAMLGSVTCPRSHSQIGTEPR